MRDKVKVLKTTGEYITLDQWQQEYGLPAGSNVIGKYFHLSEREFTENIRIQGELIIAEPLMRVMDLAREIDGKPRSVNSFNRSEAEQVALKAAYNKAATFSPHVAKMAVDIKTNSSIDTEGFVPEIREAAKKLKIKVRIGWKTYMQDGKNFVHIDVCPEFYAKGKVFHKAVIENPKLTPWTVPQEW